MVVPISHYLEGTGAIPNEVIFSLVKLFVMDKERTMRARSHGAQPPMRAPKARSYGICPSLHDRAGTFASVCIKLEYNIE